MAGLIKLTILVVALVAVAHSQRNSMIDLPREMPPDLPWIPKWVECEFDVIDHMTGPTCNDCYSTVYCTPRGGILRNCFGRTPYCVNGRCSNVPSAECADVETVTDEALAVE